LNSVQTRILFTQRNTGIWQWKRNEDVLTSTIRFCGKRLTEKLIRMGCFSGGQQHANCFVECFKNVFSRHL